MPFKKSKKAMCGLVTPKHNKQSVWNNYLLFGFLDVVVFSFVFFFILRVPFSNMPQSKRHSTFLHPEERLNRSQIHLNRKNFQHVFFENLRLFGVMLAVSHPHFFFHHSFRCYFLFSDDAILFITSRVHYALKCIVLSWRLLKYSSFQLHRKKECK